MVYDHPVEFCNVEACGNSIDEFDAFLFQEFYGESFQHFGHLGKIMVRVDGVCCLLFVVLSRIAALSGLIRPSIFSSLHS